MFEIFVVGSIFWWVLLAIASIVIIWAEEKEVPAWSFVTVAVTFLLMQFFGDLRIQNWFGGNVLFATLAWLLLYAGAGVTWGFIKWFLYSGSCLEQFEELKKCWSKTKPLPKTLIEQDEFVSYLKRNGYSHAYMEIYAGKNKKMVVIPKATSNKAKIVYWMSFWPWSALWSLADDVIVGIFKYLQRVTSELMDSVAKYRFRKTLADFKEVDEDGE